MNVQDMTFGVEIETTIPASAGVRVGGHGCGTDIPELPGWKADRDPSIRVGIAGHIPCEFVSPVFKGIEGLEQCLRDVAKIKAPVLVHHGEMDTRLAATWPAYQEALKAAGVVHDGYIYPKAQHGFHNDTTPRYDEAAAKLAWERTLGWFNKHLRGKAD